MSNLTPWIPPDPEDGFDRSPEGQRWRRQTVRQMAVGIALSLLGWLVFAPPDGFYLQVKVGAAEVSVGRAYNVRVGTLPAAPSDWTWPATPDNTGVPAGTTLTAYTGPCDITTPNTTISGKLVQCTEAGGPAPLRILTTGVTVERSQVDGGIYVGDHLVSAYDDGYQAGVDPAPNSADPQFDFNGDGPIRVTVIDSWLRAVGDFRPIGVSHFKLIRTRMTEGHSGGECHNACVIQQSYARGFGEHASGFRMYRNADVEDSTFWCEPNPESDEDGNNVPDPDGGCSADIVMYAQVPSRPNDAAWPGRLTLTRNLLKATLAYYCIRQDGRSGDGQFLFTNNVFERGNGTTHGANCGQSSAFEGFESGSTVGSSGNVLADPPAYVGGTPVSP